MFSPGHMTWADVILRDSHRHWLGAGLAEASQGKAPSHHANMRIIVGLGNPGPEYQMTRHNAGFMLLDRLAMHNGLTWHKHKKWQAELATWRPSSGSVLLVKPLTFMNVSGHSMQAAMTFHKVAPANSLVAVDDIHLPLGTLRSRANGSAGGHNGLRDIEQRIGKAYPRLRLGIGAGPDQVGHVLGRFSPQEQPTLTRMLSVAAEAVEAWLQDGIEACMRLNGPTTPAPAPTRTKPKTQPAANPATTPTQAPSSTGPDQTQA